MKIKFASVLIFAGAISGCSTSSERAHLRAPAASERPVIAFLVDGMRPDRLRRAAEQGFCPNIKALFLDKGVEVESYVPRSLTLPSWGTILTGLDPDEHGIRSNSPASRLRDGESQDFQDPRKDLLLPQYMAEGRSFRYLEDAHARWLPRYFAKDQVLLNFMPINDGAYPPILGLMKQTVAHLDQLVYGIFSGVETLDATSADTAAKAIQKHPGQYRLVMNWYATMDEYSHYDNAMLANGDAFRTIDAAIGRIAQAAKADPVLKDAALFLVSDHGHLGGFEAQDPGRKFDPHSFTMHNTAFNLIQYFAGDDPDSGNYRFRVGESASPEPDYDLFYLKEFLVEPFSYTYTGKWGSPSQGRSMLVDFSGDNLAQVYLRGPSKDWKAPRLSFYDLSHFKSEAVAAPRDIPGDLLKKRLRNTVITDPDLHARMLAATGNRPVSLFAMALPGAAAKTSADTMGADSATGPSDREPIIARDAQGRTGLILVRRDSVGEGIGEDGFRYVVLKDFNQDASGTISGKVSRDPADDPLGYLGNVKGAENSGRWHTDREWLKLAKDQDRPTAIFALARAVTLAPQISGIADRQSEIPDFILVANRGFSFQGSDLHESDHGGLAKEEVRHSFFVSGLGSSAPAKPAFLAGPYLSRDFAPTLLDFAGVGAEQAERTTRAKSLKPELDRLELE